MGLWVEDRKNTSSWKIICCSWVDFCNGQFLTKTTWWRGIETWSIAWREASSYRPFLPTIWQPRLGGYVVTKLFIRMPLFPCWVPTDGGVLKTCGWTADVSFPWQSGEAPRFYGSQYVPKCYVQGYARFIAPHFVFHAFHCAPGFSQNVVRSTTDWPCIAPTVMFIVFFTAVWTLWHKKEKQTSGKLAPCVKKSLRQNSTVCGVNDKQACTARYRGLIFVQQRCISASRVVVLRLNTWLGWSVFMVVWLQPVLENPLVEDLRCFGYIHDRALQLYKSPIRTVRITFFDLSVIHDCWGIALCHIAARRVLQGGRGIVFLYPTFWVFLFGFLVFAKMPSTV